MGLGIIEVSFEFLVQALRLPKDTVIIGVRETEHFTFNARPRSIDLKVTHPDLPAVEKGALIRNVDPQFHETRYEHIDTEFVSW